MKTNFILAHFDEARDVWEIRLQVPRERLSPNSAGEAVIKKLVDAGFGDIDTRCNQFVRNILHSEFGEDAEGHLIGGNA